MHNTNLFSYVEPMEAAQCPYRSVYTMEASDGGCSRSRACSWTSGWLFAGKPCGCRSVTGDRLGLGPKEAVGALAISVHFCGFRVLPRAQHGNEGQRPRSRFLDSRFLASRLYFCIQAAANRGLG